MSSARNEHRQIEEEGFSDPAIEQVAHHTRGLAGRVLDAGLAISADVVEEGSNAFSYIRGRIDRIKKSKRAAYKKGTEGKRP